MRRKVLPPDRSWEARAAALRGERPANLAMLAAVLAMMAALAGWIAVLVPGGGNVRGNPLFWLLAVPLVSWSTPLMRFRAWAVNTVGLALLGAPLLALAALLAARGGRTASMTLDGDGLDTPLAMLVILGVASAFSLGGMVALRRSSLPGGVRPPAYLSPDAVPAGVVPVEARAAMMAGSLAISGVLINGMMFGIAALLGAMDGNGPVWPAIIPAALFAATLAQVVRGTVRFRRGRAGAARTLRRGWITGAAGSAGLFILFWLWPVAVANGVSPLTPKLAFSVFMLPMALAAAWGARAGSRLLRRAG